MVPRGVHPDRAAARRGGDQGARLLLRRLGRFGRDRPHAQLGAGHAGRRLGQHGRAIGRQLRRRRRRHLFVSRHLRGRAVRNRAGARDRRVQPRAHGRDAQGAPGGARRREGPGLRSTAMTLPLRAAVAALAVAVLATTAAFAQEKTQKPPLHGSHWMAITGKPLAATAGARMFERGGNAVDAACAMLAATSTMWDVLSWGGETQALIYNPKTKKIIAINGLGAAPTGATPASSKAKGLKYPPEDGPLSAVTPGTPGALITMLAEFGTLSLAEVLAPSITLADGYAIDAETANRIEAEKAKIKEWKYAKSVMLPHAGQAREAPVAGEIFRQADLRSEERRVVEAEQQALKAGKSRKDAIYAAYDRFYKGDIAREYARGSQEMGGLHTEADLAKWKVQIEEPVMTEYKGIQVYKLNAWTQGPALLQALNIVEYFDVKAMGYNSARYIHTLY